MYRLFQFSVTTNPTVILSMVSIVVVLTGGELIHLQQQQKYAGRIEFIKRKFAGIE
jgi:hypothetical protein